ncbi:arginine--tRNA ligase [Candidatus Poriferisodalis sp.]|uniref:arginine--tRNA ligase n=1 Tax=Candidatus Poriferisodalis sp. TaxID=3101277 RepID=UPI003B52C16F
MEQALTGAIAGALAGLGIDADTSRLRLERPSRADHGDWSSNAAMVYAKAAKMAPRELAESVVAQLELAGLPHLERAEVAGPGFVNLHLAPSWLHELLVSVLREGTEGYACPDIGQSQTVNLEFVSANPTGPLHAGGGRWGAYGDSLARLFRRCGYETVTEYYVNDLGAQVQLFGQSLVARMTGEPVPDDGYHGDYVVEWASELAAKLRAGAGAEADVSNLLRIAALEEGHAPIPVGSSIEVRFAARWGIERALRDVGESLAAMNVSFDRWQSEASLVDSGAMDDAMGWLRDAGRVYEEDGAVWLCTSEFGDDKDRVLYRSDGEPTYFVPDIAYHDAKFGRGSQVIDVLGADHHGYVPRIAAAMQMLGHPPDSYEAIVGQNVTLMRDGQIIELSKRTGTMVEVRELIDAVGPDVARFAFLLQSIDSRQTIDIDLLSAQASENPVFYVQYAHARIASVARRAESDGVAPVPPAGTDLSSLDGERELALLRALEVLPSVVEIALRDRAPHRVTTWVRDLAGAFHGFYHDCPILHCDVLPEVRDARLCLTEGTRIGLAIGLDLLGVDAPSAM